MNPIALLLERTAQAAGEQVGAPFDASTFENLVLELDASENGTATLDVVVEDTGDDPDDPTAVWGTWHTFAQLSASGLVRETPGRPPLGHVRARGTVGGAGSFTHRVRLRGQTRE